MIYLCLSIVFYIYAVLVFSFDFDLNNVAVICEKKCLIYYILRIFRTTPLHLIRAITQQQFFLITQWKNIL